MPMPYAIGKAHHQSPCEFAEILKYLSVVQSCSTLFAGHGFLEHWGIVSFGGPVSGLGLSRLSLFAHCKGSHTLNTKVLKDVQVVQNISS